jgi:hypothetical protein
MCCETTIHFFKERRKLTRNIKIKEKLQVALKQNNTHIPCFTLVCFCLKAPCQFTLYLNLLSLFLGLTLFDWGFEFIEVFLMKIFLFLPLLI